MLNLNNPFDKRGFYQVGDKKFYRKVDAILEQQKTGLFPTWNFNDDVFCSFDWTKPVNDSLPDLYKLRAKQLREKYDYLILLFSGGIDSYTALRAFIDNNILVDEILIFGAFDGTNSTKNSSKEGWNLRSEIEYQALPLLKKLNLDSRTKVTLYDYTHDLIKFYQQPYWYSDLNPGIRYNPNIPKNILIHNSTRGALSHYDQGKSVGFIHGIDKPRITYMDGHYWLYFIDVQLSVSTSDHNQTKNLYWENDELFYWTPDLPELLAKQSQVIVNWFSNNPLSRSYLDLNSNVLVRDGYYSIINNLIYPLNNEITWQVKKPNIKIFQDTDYWFLTEQNPGYTNWYQGLQDLKTQIPSEWLNSGVFNNGIVGCYSKFHKIK